MTYNDLIKIGATNCKLNRYLQKKKKAIEVCCDQLKTHENPYVAVSGGKDSVAMTFIVNEAAKIVNKDFRLWVHISDASFPGTIETCRELSEMIRRPLDVYESEKSAFDCMNDKKKQDFGKTGIFFDSIRKYAADKDLCFVGVRANESKRRMQAAKAHGMTFHSKSMGNIDVVNPLQWFTIYDVFSILSEYNAPVHPIYKKFAVDNHNNSNGEPLFIRLGYVTAKDLMDKGTVLFLKVNYPELYNKLVQYAPDVARFT